MFIVLNNSTKLEPTKKPTPPSATDILLTLKDLQDKAKAQAQAQPKTIEIIDIEDSTKTRCPLNQVIPDPNPALSSVLHSRSEISSLLKRGWSLRQDAVFKRKPDGTTVQVGWRLSLVSLHPLAKEQL